MKTRAQPADPATDTVSRVFVVTATLCAGVLLFEHAQRSEALRSALPQVCTATPAAAARPACAAALEAAADAAAAAPAAAASNASR